MKSAGLITFFQRLFLLRRTQRTFKSPRYLLKWLLISTLIGLVAGIGAIAFYAAIAIRLATGTLLGGLIGYLPPDPAGEGHTAVMPFWTAARPWLLPLVTAGGGLLAGILVFSLAPETEGHGTDAAIAAFHQGKPIRARIPLIKLVASAITIGSGGSAGREGPSAQISAGFGSLLGTFLHLDMQDRRIAIATGIGAGIGAIFRAPLGGAILAAEILYKHDLEIEAIIPGLIASIIGYSVFGVWSGWNPIFATHGNLAFTSPPQLLYYVMLGILCGLVGLLYARGFYGMTHVFHRLQLPKWVKPGIGGLLVGLIGLVLPQALGMGYGWVQVSMGPGLLSLPLWVILLLPFAKIVTTGLSVGSGGSGGIFGPGMVIGGMVGASVWRLCYHVLPGIPDTPAPFVIVGMMALFGGIAHAPLAVMLMVAEMTGNLSVLAPAMIAVGISSIIVGNATIYTSQVDTRGSLLGVLTLADVQRVPLSERAQRRVEETMNRDVLVMYPDETLDEALEQLTSRRVGWAPVVDVEVLHERRHLVGMLSVTDIVRAYRETLAKTSRRMRGLVEGTVMLEVKAEPGARLVGVPLRDTHLPPESLVVSIRRRGELIFPRGSAIIEPGDMVTFLVSPSGEERLHQYLAEQVGKGEPVLLD